MASNLPITRLKGRDHIFDILRCIDGLLSCTLCAACIHEQQQQQSSKLNTTKLLYTKTMLRAIRTYGRRIAVASSTVAVAVRNIYSVQMPVVRIRYIQNE